MPLYTRNFVLSLQGNRAKWIGCGCMLIGIANILISTSNFLFPVERVSLKTSEFEYAIERDLRRLPDNGESFIPFLPVNYRTLARRKGLTQSLAECDVLYDRNQSSQYCEALQVITYSIMLHTWLFLFHLALFFQSSLHQHNPTSVKEVEGLRAMSATSYAFCDKTLNRLRNLVGYFKNHIVYAF